jgi:hypothetical protein
MLVQLMLWLQSIAAAALALLATGISSCGASRRGALQACIVPRGHPVKSAAI